MRSRLTLAAAAAAATATLAPAAALANPTINTDKTVELQSNTTQEIVVPIEGLGQSHNVLEPCYGFEIKGSGVDLAAANLEPFGPVLPENPNAPDGGIPGAQRQGDGSFTIPASAAVLTAEDLRMGANCRSVGWRFSGPDGVPLLDPYGNPRAAHLAKAASKRQRAAARKRMSRRIVGKAA